METLPHCSCVFLPCSLIVFLIFYFYFLIMFFCFSFLCFCFHFFLIPFYVCFFCFFFFFFVFFIFVLNLFFGVLFVFFSTSVLASSRRLCFCVLAVLSSPRLLGRVDDAVAWQWKMRTDEWCCWCIMTNRCIMNDNDFFLLCAIGLPRRLVRWLWWPQWIAICKS